MKDTVFVYEIYLNEECVGNSGDLKFKSEKAATHNAFRFIQNLLETESEYEDFIEEDFDVDVFEITVDDFAMGW